MKIATSIQIFSFLSVVYACDGHSDHTHERRSVAPSTVTPPKGPLEWGDINILHTTDTHGWLLGHQKESFPEPNYSGDFGDFASFVVRMKALAEKKPKADFLLIDSGDLHDGSGMTEGGLPDSVDGHDANEIFDDLPYDLLTIGNHELYSYKVAADVHENFARKFAGKYLTSNVFITPPGESEAQPFGDQVQYLKTRNGRSVTAFGILFDFQGFDKTGEGKISVQSPEDMVKEDWFKQAIEKEADLFVIPGHMPVGFKDRDNKWNAVRKVIRGVPKHQFTPIIILGGHSHIRDCAQTFPGEKDADEYTMALQSGRFMETVGWLSVKLSKNKSAAEKPQFSRRYLDTNTVTYEYHTGLHGPDFVTELGKTVSESLTKLVDKFGLSIVFGKTTTDYTLNQKDFKEEGNLAKLWIEKAVPYALKNDPRKKGKNDNIVVIANPNSLRFDLYSGPFTKNDQLSVSFYTDKFFYLPDIPLEDVNYVLTRLNNPKPPATKIGNRRSLVEERELADDMGDVEERYRTWMQDMHRRYEVERRDLVNSNFDDSDTLGYVTKDSCSTMVGDGDDTVHRALPSFKLPDIINSVVPPVAKTVDLVFIDYIWNQRSKGNILKILNDKKVGKPYNLTSEDAKVYSDIASNEAIAIYAEGNWNTGGI